MDFSESPLQLLVQGLTDCPICCDYMNDSIECYHCYSLFCKNCLDSWLKDHSTCPSCRKQLSRNSCKNNIPVQRFINSLPIPCPHQVYGCHANPSKNDLDIHIQSCEYHPDKIKEQKQKRIDILLKKLNEYSNKINEYKEHIENKQKNKNNNKTIDYSDIKLLIFNSINITNDCKKEICYKDACNILEKLLILSQLCELYKEELECFILLGYFYTQINNYSNANEYLNNAKILLNNDKNNTFNEYKVDYLKYQGELYLKLGQYKDAEIILSQVKDIYIINRPSGKIMAELLNLLGLLCKKQSQYAESLTYYKQALKYITKSNELWINIATNLADTHRKLGEYSEAKDLYIKVLQVIKEHYGSDNVLIASPVYSSLGIIQKKKGEYDSALKYYQQSSKIIKRLYGNNNHELVAINHSNIGDVYRKLGKYEKAETSYYTAMNSLIELHGPEHIEIADILHSQGLVFKKQGLYDKAEINYTKALDIIEKTFGKKHYKYGIFLNSLGDIERKRGNYTNANTIYNNSLIILQDTLGPTHTEVADVMFSLGLIDHLQEHYENAIKKFNNAHEIIINEFGKHHYKEGLILNNRGLAYGMLCKFEDAYDDLKNAKFILTKQLGNKHIEVADCLTSLGDICMKLYVENGTKTSKKSKLSEAKEYYNEANIIVKETFGINHKKAEQLASLLFICDNYSMLI